ncbi:hypothetical protein BH11BAC1_BH11BAC1_30040 [soil metagenome]
MKLEIEITRKDYADFNKFHYLKYKFRRSTLTILVVLILLQLILNGKNFSLGKTIVSTITALLVYFGIIYFALSKSKKIPSADGSILGKREMEFLEDSIKYKSETGEGTRTWASIKKLEEGKNAYYLYLDANMGVIVPKRFFSSEAAKNDFVDLVKRKINIA